MPNCKGCREDKEPWQMRRNKWAPDGSGRSSYCSICGSGLYAQAARTERSRDHGYAKRHGYNLDLIKTLRPQWDSYRASLTPELKDALAEGKAARAAKRKHDETTAKRCEDCHRELMLIHFPVNQRNPDYSGRSRYCTECSSTLEGKLRLGRERVNDLRTYARTADPDWHSRMKAADRQRKRQRYTNRALAEATGRDPRELDTLSSEERARLLAASVTTDDIDEEEMVRRYLEEQNDDRV